MKKVFDESLVPPERPTVKLRDTLLGSEASGEEKTMAHHVVARFYASLKGFRPVQYQRDNHAEMRLVEGGESLANMIRKTGDMVQLGRLRDAVVEGKKIGSGTKRKLLKLIDRRIQELMKP